MPKQKSVFQSNIWNLKEKDFLLLAFTEKNVDTQINFNNLWNTL